MSDRVELTFAGPVGIRCCFIGCHNRATWGAVGSGMHPSVGTESCDDHVGDLIGDSPRLMTWPIAPERLLTFFTEVM